MKIKITEVREGILDIDPANYPEDQRDFDSIVEIEKENHAESIEYMDVIDADSKVTFELVKKE